MIKTEARWARIMHRPALAFASAMAFMAVALSGCVTGDDSIPDAAESPLDDVLQLVTVTANITFVESVVDAAVSFASDLYEPTMEVSPSGAIFITGHTILVDTTGAPVFGSWDDGQTWEQLPWFDTLTMPEPVHGATPPPSDEIFLVAGDDGWLYGVDITLATYPVNAWSDDGHRHAYHNPDAYDETQGMMTRTTLGDCFSLSLNDRPWADYANGTLLMVNNPGGGPVQVGVMQVPPTMPVGGPATPVSGATWNLCASEGGGIPGVPALRDDGLFVVPQVEGGERLIVVRGNAADVFDVETVEVFPFTSAAASSVINSGHAVFDATGDLFVAAMNNTYTVEEGEGLFGPFEGRQAQGGQIKVAASTDGAHNFTTTTFAFEGIVQSMYLDGNMNGSGALMTWALEGDADGTSDWFMGHLVIGDSGAPELTNVALVVDDGPRPSAHVVGAALGPDGRAYLSMHDGTEMGTTPLSVFIQQDGPTLV